MAPRWLHRSDDGGKRTSVFSSITNSRKEHQQDATGSLTMPPPHETSDNTFFDQLSDAISRPSTASRQRSTSRKRLSLFGRSPALAQTEIEPVPPIAPQYAAYVSPEPELVSVFEDDEPRSRAISRKRASKYFTRHRDDSASRWTSRPSTATSEQDNPFEDEASRGIRKISISSPFNFQHITHTQHQQLPNLDSTDDRELTNQFWEASTRQTPQGDLRGIRAEDLSSLPCSRPNSRPASPSGTVRSPFIGKSPRPVLPASYFSSPEIQHRPNAMVRSASVADLMAQRRAPPSMVHPALRASDAPTTQPLGLGLDLGAPQLADGNKGLDAVPEELEIASAPTSPSKPLLDRRVSHMANFANQMAQQSSRDYSVTSTMCSSVQEIGDPSQWQDSLPSLASSDSWEEDIDYCYNTGMEAEAESEGSWGQSTDSFGYLDPRDSVMPAQRKFRDSDGTDVSPRTSFANHIRKKSSMVLNDFFTIVTADDEWNPEEAFENPRIPPDTPQTGLSRPSSTSDATPVMDVPSFEESDEVAPSTPQRPMCTVTTGSVPSTPIFEEMVKRRSQLFDADSSLLAAPKGHLRSRSEGNQAMQSSSPHPPNARWSFIPPSVLSQAGVSPDSSIAAHKALPTRPVSFGAYLHPPPTAPLPPLPQPRRRANTVNFSHKRETMILAPNVEFDILMRRPQTWEDRSILQAAGRTAQGDRVQRISPTRPRRVSPSNSASTTSLVPSSEEVPSSATEAFPAWI